MKKLIALGTVIALIAAAVVIAQRLSTDALAIIIGVVFGVAASIPTSLLIIAVTRPHRDDGPIARHDEYRQPAPPPQIVVIQPGPGQWQGQPPQLNAPWHDRPPRQQWQIGAPKTNGLHVIGDDGEYDEW